jgi:hypothetical protein
MAEFRSLASAKDSPLPPQTCRSQGRAADLGRGMFLPSCSGSQPPISGHLRALGCHRLVGRVAWPLLALARRSDAGRSNFRKNYKAPFHALMHGAIPSLLN